MRTRVGVKGIDLKLIAVVATPGRLAWSRTRVPGSWPLSDFIKGLGPIEPYVVETTLPVSDS